ncbi:MAG TPA: hypothetical protein VFY48_03215 [Solirubrobacterales bacterium]|nr:hypothetical protein [Solirubrobacterales bacterium]
MIEGYRQRNGVTDRSRAFGAEPRDRAAQERQRLEVQWLRRYQQQLRQDRTRQRVMEGEIGLGLGLGR